MLPYGISYIFFQCARDLCRFMDAAQSQGDLVSATVFYSECQVFRSVLVEQARRIPLAARHLKMVDEMLKLQAESSDQLSAKFFG